MFPGPYVMLSETKHLALVLNKRNCEIPAFPFGQLPKVHDVQHDKNEVWDASLLPLPIYIIRCAYIYRYKGRAPSLPATATSPWEDLRKSTQKERKCYANLTVLILHGVRALNVKERKSMLYAAFFLFTPVLR